MNAQEIIQLIILGEQAIGPIVEMIAKLKLQSGLSDEQLLAEAEKGDQQVRDAVAAHLARVSGK
jgi:predicted NBD/HSP70 family sugar kinase